MRLKPPLCKFSALMALLFFCTGCLHTPRYMTPDFGASYEAAFKAQPLNPEGPSDKSPADTLPGAIANDIYKKRYIKSMTEDKKEKKETVGKELRDLN